ncbi:hypothetical protein Tco_1308080 [Tanacetum coccineum]
MSIMEDDLFTYEVEIVEVTNIPCNLKKEDDSKQKMPHESDDDMEYDPSNDRGDDEVELTDEESSDSNNEDEIAKIFRIKTNTYKEYKDDWIYEWNKDVTWVHERPWTKNGVWKEPTLVKHHCKPFNYKRGCSDWPTCSWKDDEYCNEGNLPRAYIIRNTLCYQDLEWYDALKDRKLKEEALKNKAIMEGMIDEDEKRCEVFDDHEWPVCYIRRFEMVKYSFRDDEEYVAIKENEYNDLPNTSKKAIHAYQEIFRMMDGVWMVSQYGVFQFMDMAYWFPVQFI